MSDPAPLPSVGLVLGAAVTNQGGDAAYLPSVGLLLAAAAANQGGYAAPLPHIGLLLGDAAQIVGRRPRRSRTKFLPPADGPEETPAQAKPAAQEPKAGLVDRDAMTLIVETVAADGARRMQQKARVAAAKRRMEIQTHNAGALERVLAEWF